MDIRNVEDSPITLKNLIAWIVAGGGLLCTIITAVLYVSSINGRVDLISQRESAYELHNDSTRSMLLKDRDDWRAGTLNHLGNLDTKTISLDHAFSDLQNKLTELTVKQEDCYSLLQKIDAKVNK